MAGSELPDAPTGWRRSEWRDEVLIAPDADTPPEDAAKVSIEATDPYFLWAAENGGRRLAQVLPSVAPVEGRAASAAMPGLASCMPESYRVPQAFLQVLIQVASGLEDDADKLRRKELDEHMRVSRGGLRIRGAHKGIDAATQSQFLLPEVRYVTGIVADWWLACFLKRIERGCVRWEIGHARSPIKAKRPSESPGEEPAIEHHHGWDPADTLLDGDVMVIIDHGCPFAHPDFRRGDRSRVRYIWFQGSDALAPGTPLPRPIRHGSNQRLFPYGKELRGSVIDGLMLRHRRGGSCDEAACYESLGYDLMREVSSHGGHVMSIACGAPDPLARRDGEDWLSGLGSAGRGGGGGDGDGDGDGDRASQSQIIFIELPRQAVADSSGGAMNVHLVDALNYVLLRTAETARITVNCSFGTHCGPHDGSSLLEEALDEALSRRPEGLFNLVVPIGNAFNSACHAFANVLPDAPLRALIDIPADKTTDTFVEVWFPHQIVTASGPVALEPADIAVELTTPDGRALRPAPGNTVACWFAPGTGGAPSVTAVQTGCATPTRHRMLLVIAPTGTRSAQDSGAAYTTADSGGVAPYGHWGIAVYSRRQELPIPTDIWIERDDPIFDPPADRQSRFVTEHQTEPAEDYANSGSATKAATFTSYCTGMKVYVAGAYVRPVHRDDLQTNHGRSPLLAAYSSAGSSSPHLRMNKPQVLAATDDSMVLLGRNAAGNLSRSWVRRNGSSVAAPQLARHLLNTNGRLDTLQPFNPSRAGERGDGLSAAGEALQLDRAGLSLRIDW